MSKGYFMIFSNERIQELKHSFCLSEYVLDEVGKDGFNRVGDSDDFVGPCPIHEDNTPSFRVNDTRFRCFGCGKSGDIFKWLEYRRGLSFVEAIKFLSGEGQINLAPKPSAPKTPISIVDCLKASHIIEINAHAQNFFLSQVPDSLAENYITSRVNKSSRDYFGLGYAPLDGRLLYEYLKGKGVAADLQIEASLAVRTESGGVLSRYHDRLIIPLVNKAGNILGFSGREIPRESTKDRRRPKFMEPSNTAAYSKKRSLYGWQTYRPTAPVYVVEGALDAITIWEKTNSNVLALSGCSLSQEQVNLLEEYYRMVIISLDGDGAGLDATIAASKLLCKSKILQASHILTPSGEGDPCDIVNRGGQIWDFPAHSSAVLQGNKLTFPQFCIMQIRTDKITKDMLDLTLLHEVTKPYVDSNIKSGFPHYNVIDFVCAAQPAFAGEIKFQSSKMFKEMEKLPNGKLSPTRKNIDLFITAWAKACREVRRGHIGK